MPFRQLCTALVLVCALIAPGHSAWAEDIAGSADHPLVPRYEDSEIIEYEQQEFTDHRILVAEAENYGGIDKNLDSTLSVEGKLTRITYRAPADRSTLEVFRNYEAALAAAGFETIFTCAKAECGGRNFNHASQTAYMIFGEHYAEQRYLAAKRPSPDGDVYVALYVVLNRSGGGANKDRTMVQLDLVEAKPMESRMVVVEAPAMQNELASEGRIAIYGIRFDFDKATLRPDSEPQLQEIARLMTDHPDLEVLIVGHTDNQGSIDYNLDLSKRRAEAVVAAVAKLGIDAKRMTPLGVGMGAPVATNRSEEGRALNRRVELVER